MTANNLSVVLSQQRRARLRAAATAQGVTLSALVENVLVEYVGEDADTVGEPTSRVALRVDPKVLASAKTAARERGDSVSAVVRAGIDALPD